MCNNGVMLCVLETGDTEMSVKFYAVWGEGEKRPYGWYYALNATQAIRKFLDEQAATASTFRCSQPMMRFINLRAEETEPKG